MTTTRILYALDWSGWIGFGLAILLALVFTAAVLQMDGTPRRDRRAVGLGVVLLTTMAWLVVAFG